MDTCADVDDNGVPLVSTAKHPCYDWCKKFPDVCDTMKLSWCSKHKEHDYCKCLYPTYHQDFHDQIKDNEDIYALADPVCYYRGCRQNDPVDVLKTQSVINKQEGQACAKDLNILRQSIDVEGEGNIVEGEFGAGDEKPDEKNDDENGGILDGVLSDDQKKSLKNLFGDNYQIILILFILLIIYFIVSNVRKDKIGGSSFATVNYI